MKISLDYTLPSKILTTSTWFLNLQREGTCFSTLGTGRGGLTRRKRFIFSFRQSQASTFFTKMAWFIEISSLRICFWVLHLPRILHLLRNIVSKYVISGGACNLHQRSPGVHFAGHWNTWRRKCSRTNLTIIPLMFGVLVSFSMSYIMVMRLSLERTQSRSSRKSSKGTSSMALNVVQNTRILLRSSFKLTHRGAFLS